MIPVVMTTKNVKVTGKYKPRIAHPQLALWVRHPCILASEIIRRENVTGLQFGWVVHTIAGQRQKKMRARRIRKMIQVAVAVDQGVADQEVAEMAAEIQAAKIQAAKIQVAEQARESQRKNKLFIALTAL
jgi:hypothetical protein